MANLSFFETCQSIVVGLQARACYVLPTLEDAYNHKAYSAKSDPVVTFPHKQHAVLYNLVQLDLAPRESSPNHFD
jgi:hypothetical protein